MTTLPTREQIERAEPLEFTTRPSERQANITIEVTPAGLVVRAEYTGALASIPAAIDKLRAEGVLELVSAAAPATPTPAASAPTKPKAERVEPLYKPDGTACCPIHQRPLADGRYGPYCTAKAKPGEQANEKGYCALRFNA